MHRTAGPVWSSMESAGESIEGPDVDAVGQRRATTAACFFDAAAAGHLPDPVSLACPSEVLLLTAKGPVSQVRVQ